MTACAIDLVCISLRPHGLVVLLAGARGGVRLPSVRWAGESSLDVGASELVRATLNCKTVWTAQVSARAVREHPLRARLSITYLVAVPEPAAPVERAEWCAVAKLPRLLRACHRDSVMDAVAFASQRADRWAVSLALLPAEFTLTQLQHAHEALLGRRLYKASFRRVAKSVAPISGTDQWRAEGRGRPAQLYRPARVATR